MISRQKSQFYVAILRPQALLRHTNVAQERNQKLCLLYEIDGNIWLHREGKVLETGLLKKLWYELMHLRIAAWNWHASKIQSGTMGYRKLWILQDG